MVSRIHNQLSLNDGLSSAIDLYQAHRPAEAIALLRPLAKRFAGSAKLWGYLGFLYKEMNNLPNAVRAFQKATRISPRSEQASLALFHALWRGHDESAAFDEARRFVRVGETREYRKLLRDMLADSSDSMRDKHSPTSRAMSGGVA